MDRKHNAFRLLVDLVIPTMVLVVLFVVLLFEQKGYQVTDAKWYEDTFIDQDRWEEIQSEQTQTAAYNGRSVLLVTAFGDDESAEVYAQVNYVLSSMGVETSLCEVTLTEINTEENEGDDIVEPLYSTDLCQFMPVDCTDVFLCTTALHSSNIDAVSLSDWVEHGGHLVIASALETEELTEEWFPVLGIHTLNNAEGTLADSMYFETSFLAGANGMEFSDEVINCIVADATLLPNCQVHITNGENKTLPLLWEHSYGQGHVLVCNADLMDNKTGRGMIAAAFSRLDTVFVYPVINAAVYCIDDFPSAAPAGYDDNVLKQFGYTVEDYYYNVWWPAMQKLSEKYDIRYSAFCIQCYEADVNGSFDNRDHYSSASYFAKLLLEGGHEIGLHGYNHQPLVLEGYTFDEKNEGYTPWKTVEKMMESVQAGIDYTESLADDIYVQSYVAPSNVLSQEAMSAMTRRFEDVRILAGVYIGTDDQLVQEFEVLENNVVQVPRLTADMQMEDSEWWLQVNELNYHYYESNFIHPDDILDEERSDGGDLSAMLESYEQMIVWNQNYVLRTSTISEAAGAVQRYANLTVSQYSDSNGLRIHIDGLIDCAWLMMRTDKVPSKATGCTVIKIDDGVYILEVTQSDAEIQWEVSL